ncbi:hypothetical protein [Aeromonas phage phiWae14]|nr:hypothetical protein [Aeromonas phage phiWae14]
MKRYFLFRGNHVFAVDSDNHALPLDAITISDGIFELDRFGMLMSIKDRYSTKFRLFDSVNAMFRHMENDGDIAFKQADGIQLVTMDDIVEKLTRAAHDFSHRKDL